VEHVGNLMVQHYVEDVSERGHCRLVSTSDSIGPDINGHTKVIVIWSFTAERIYTNSTKFTNSVEVHSTPEYLQILEERGIPFTKASEAVQVAVSAHNAEETLLFAKDIERKAVARRWAQNARAAPRSLSHAMATGRSPIGNRPLRSDHWTSLSTGRSLRTTSMRDSAHFKCQGM
jgi:hypothetical protein